MKKNTRLPSSAGGIVQYFDDTSNITNFSPNQVIMMTVMLILIVLFLRLTNVLGF